MLRRFLDRFAERRGPAVFAAIVTLVLYCLVRYRDTVFLFFFLDDFWLMHSAAEIQGNSPTDLLAIFHPTHTGFQLYRPFTQVGYFYFLRQLFEYDSSGYHAVQLLVYAVNTVLVFAITRKLTDSTLAAFAGGLLYATAPGHASAVFWVAAFTMSGTALTVFVLSLCWLYTRSVWRVVLCTLLQAIALLASEHAVVGPFLLALLWLLLPRREPWRRAALALAPALLLVTGYLVLKLWYFSHVAAPSMGYTMWLDPLGWLERIGRYAAACVNALTLVASGSRGWRVIGGLVLALWLLSSWRAFRSGGPWTIVAGGLAMFLIGLLPVLPLRDHVYSYFIGIAALGVVVALLGVCQLAGRHWRWIALALGLSVVTLDLATGQRAARGDEIVQLIFAGAGAAANWVAGVQRAVVMRAPTRGALLPRDPTTEYVFGIGRAETYLPLMPPSVELYDFRRPPPALGEGEIMVAHPAWLRPGEPLPGWHARWEWLRALAHGGAREPRQAQTVQPRGAAGERLAR